MENEYKYNLRSRPFGIGTYPRNENFIRFEEDGTRYGCLVYSKPLSIELMEKYELVPITDILKYDGANMLWNNDYEAKISVLKNDKGTYFVKIIISYKGSDGKPTSESAIDFLKNIENGKYKLKEKMGKFNVYDRISLRYDEGIKGMVKSIEPDNEYLIKWDSLSDTELVPENELILAVEEEVEGDVYYTTATEAYDGFGTRTLGMTDYLDRRNKPVRKIFIPEKAKEWQKNRNASGNNSTFTEAEFEQYKNTILAKNKEMTNENKTETKIVESIIQTEKNKAPLDNIEIQNSEIKDLSYQPQSDTCTTVDTVVPSSMRYDMHKAIETIDRRVNGVDEYVAEKLGYIVGKCSMEERKTGLKCLCDAFSAEQVDAIAVAIYNIEEKKQGCIIGDQTGIGKGRIAAGMIRYAVHRGLKPIFLTEKPNLFSDLFRDIINIGSDDAIPLQILVGNKLVEKKVVRKDDDEDDDSEDDKVDEGFEEEESEFISEDVYQKNKEYPNNYTYLKKDENGIEKVYKRERKSSMIPFIINGGGKKTAIKDEEGNIIYKGSAKIVEGIIGKNQKTKTIIGTTPAGNPKYATEFIEGTMKIPDEYNFILATYTQFNKGAGTPKSKLLMDLAKGNVVIMDESHNASGESNVGEFLRNVLEGTLGVTFLSATFAKRPDNMAIYASKTALSEANLTPEALTQAIISGGVSLQEIVATNLTAEGQMIRRERSFEGIEVNYEYLDQTQTRRGYPNLDLEQKHLAIMDRATDIIRDIMAFQEEYVNPLIEEMDKEQKAEYKEVGQRKGTAKGGVDNPPVFSGIFNVINQLLFSIKAESVAEVAIQRLKEGKKPVIAFANTMESFLNTMTNDDGTLARENDIINSDFSKIMEKRLNGVLKYTIVDPDGNKDYETINPNEQEPQFRLEYESILNKIRSHSIGISSSPIDVLIDKIQKAGYSIVEVTGRDKQLKMLGKDTAMIKSRIKIGANDAFRQFNNNEIDCLLINQSGSTGASAHAIPNAKVSKENVRQRVMIILQAELNINTEVQKRGRINRTGQILKPIYDYVISAIPAEKRLMMMLQRKLKSLDANTTSSQKQNEDIMDNRNADFLNKYGDEIVLDYLKENPLINTAIGDPLKIKDLKPDVIPADAAHRVSGRVAILSSKDQENFYSEISQRYASLVEYLRQTGEYDLEVENMNLQAETIEKEVVVVGKGGNSVFGRHSILEKIKANNLRKPYTKDDIDAMIEETLGDYDKDSLSASQMQSFKRFMNNTLEEDLTYINEHMDNLIKEVSNEKKISALSGYEKEQAIRDRKDDIEESRESQINRAKAINSAKSHNISRLFNFFKVGEAVAYPSITYKFDQAFQYAIFLGFVINEGIKNPYAPSAIKMRFAIAGSQRYVAVPASKNDIIDAVISLTTTEMYSSDKEYVFSNWDDIIAEKTSDKTTRYVVTGNILQAFGSKELKGSLISYTTSTGGVKQGILLPESFSKDAQGTKKGITITVPILTALPIISSMIKERIMTTNDGISFLKYDDDTYHIGVNASVKGGGKYFLDKTLIALSNEGTFNKKGTTMVASFDAMKIDNVVKYIQTTFNSSMELIKQEFDRIKHTIVIEDYTDEEKIPETDVFIEKLTEVNRDGDSALKAKEFEAEQKEHADELERIENDKKEGENFDIEKRKLKVQRKLISLMRLL